MKKKILLVDDEETLRWALHEALTEEGYDVENTNDSVKALEFTRKTNYDLVISDLKMPTMGGLQLISEIKKIHPDMKAIIITAYGSIETVIEAMHAGVVDFLTKPFKIEHIKSVIRRVLNDSLMSKGNGSDVRGSEELKIEYDDPCKQRNTYFVAKDTTGTSNHIFYDFVETGKLKAFLFGSVSCEVEIKNLDIMVRTIFRYVSKMSKSSATLLKEVNQYLCENIFKRFPVALFCAILDEQRQTICYSTHGEELTCLLSMPNKEVKLLESNPVSLNVFPGIMVRESNASFVSGSRLILIDNRSLSKNLKKGVSIVDSFRGVISEVSTSSCEDMAKGIRLQIGRHDELIAEEDVAIMVSSLEFEASTALDVLIPIAVPIDDYGEMLELFDKKLSAVVVDNYKRYEIVTSINEAIINAASFAYKQDKKGEIVLKFYKLGDEIIVEVCDRGCGFDIQAYREPDVMSYKDLTKKSGRGIFIMKQLMDRVTIQSCKDIGTTVYMAKRVSYNEN